MCAIMAEVNISEDGAGGERKGVGGGGFMLPSVYTTGEEWGKWEMLEHAVVSSGGRLHTSVG